MHQTSVWTAAVFIIIIIILRAVLSADPLFFVWAAADNTADAWCCVWAAADKTCLSLVWAAADKTCLSAHKKKQRVCCLGWCLNVTAMEKGWCLGVLQWKRFGAWMLLEPKREHL
jgi:hypothetical protein